MLQGPRAPDLYWRKVGHWTEDANGENRMPLGGVVVEISVIPLGSYITCWWLNVTCFAYKTKVRGSPGDGPGGVKIWFESIRWEGVTFSK